MDLLTVVMHEFGHIFGLPDLDPAAHRGELMAGVLKPGERRHAAALAVAPPVVDSPVVESRSESGVGSAPTVVRRVAPAVPSVPAPASHPAVSTKHTRDLLFAQLSGIRPRPAKAIMSHGSEASSGLTATDGETIWREILPALTAVTL